MSNYENVARRAYEIWEKEGKPEGKETEHWLQAEREVRQQEGFRNPAKRASQLEEPQPGNGRGMRYEREAAMHGRSRAQ